MADAADSKSAEGNFMRVRLPPSAPEKKLRMSFRHKLRAPIKKGVFFYGIKEHTNLGASVCEGQTSINAVCDAMADAADSKSAEGNFMRVRLPPSAPREKTMADIPPQGKDSHKKTAF